MSGKPKVRRLEDLLERTSREGECFLWTGSISKQGYARLGPIEVHRLAFQLANGILIHTNFDVMHACRNRHCINPDHLSQGTRSDNLTGRDRYKGGLCKRGHDLATTGKQRPGSHLFCAVCFPNS